MHIFIHLRRLVCSNDKYPRAAHKVTLGRRMTHGGFSLLIRPSQQPLASAPRISSSHQPFASALRISPEPPQVAQEPPESRPGAAQERPNVAQEMTYK